MRKRNVFEAIIVAAVITNIMCASKPRRAPPYQDIEAFFKMLGKLWIIETATENGQESTACKLYDVRSVKNGQVFFGRIFYRNGTRVELPLTGTLSVESHRVLAEHMNYKTVMKVSPAGEKVFEERLLYQSHGRECGVFKVRSLSDGRLRTSSEFHELRLWNSSAVSQYKDCLKAYAERVPDRSVITTYYNGLCKKITNETT